MTQTPPLPLAGIQVIEIGGGAAAAYCDELSPDWPDDNFLARAQFADAAARKALLSTVRRRTIAVVAPEALAGIDLPLFTRAKLAPMVRIPAPTPARRPTQRPTER